MHSTCLHGKSGRGKGGASTISTLPMVSSTPRECTCCQEVPRMVTKINEEEIDGIMCITDHPGFHGVSLDQWVLQTTYFQF